MDVIEKAYNKGYADGSLSVTEQIIKEKVIKVLEEIRANLTIQSDVKLINELIEEFSK